MRRIALAAVALLAACSPADAGPAPDDDAVCDGSDLSCELLGAEQVEEVWPVEADFVPVDEVGIGADPPVWCERPAPVAEQTERAVLRGTDAAGTTAWVVASTASRFSPDDAAATLDAVRSIPQGCEWSEGDATFQLLETLGSGGFGDDSVVVTLRTAVAGAAQNVDQAWVRVGDTVVTVSIVPALGRPDVVDQLVRAALG